MKRTPLKRSNKPLKRTKLRIAGHSSTSEIKKEIQELLRQICLIRDGGCVLRHYHEAGNCGGFRNDGGVIYQAEHLVTRENTATFGDIRNCVILCRNHHMFFKPQHSSLYWELIRKHIGEERWTWMIAMRDDWRPHKADWKLVKLVLEQDLKKALSKSSDIL